MEMVFVHLISGDPGGDSEREILTTTSGWSAHGWVIPGGGFIPCGSRGGL